MHFPSIWAKSAAEGYSNLPASMNTAGWDKETPGAVAFGGTRGCVMPSRQEGSGMEELRDWKVTVPSAPPLCTIRIVLGPRGAGVVAKDPAEKLSEISLSHGIVHKGKLLRK